MGRREQTDDTEQPAASPAIGGNVTDETLRAFERDYMALKAKVDEARSALAARCKSAQDVDGIDLKTFKQVRKLKDLLPPEAEAKIHTFTNYTKQLGIFDQIQAYRQAEATEDNAASVDAAERERAA
jgi:hypothetical protein